MIKFYKSFKTFIRLNRHFKNKKNLIFFSEGSHHWAHLEPLIKKIVNDQKIIFLTISENDEGLNYKHDKFFSFSINSIFFLNLFFKTIKSSIIITSLPDLGKYFFKKYNQNNNKFIYIFHSLASVHTQYNIDAFNQFDFIFVPSEYQKNELSLIEEKYKLKKKTIIEIGYPRIDILRKKKSYNTNNFKNILIAPSWGEGSITQTIIFELIELLLKENKYNIIYRPHVMSFKKDIKVINNVLHKYKNFSKFSLDKSNSSIKTLLDSDILISDWGSTFIDFSLGLEKPVILFNTEMKLKNKDYKLITDKCVEIEMRKKLSFQLELNELKDLSNLLNNINKRLTEFRDKISKNNFIYNLDNSIEKSCKAILKIFKSHGDLKN